MINIRELGSLQIDGLREIANIGAGHAATALSQMTNRRILIDVPQVRVVPAEEIADLTGNPEEIVASVVMQLLGDITGRTVQIFPGPTARRLAGILLGRDDVQFPDGFDELEQSALKEAGNILAGAYLNALSDVLGMLLLTSVPGLAVDHASAVLVSSSLSAREDSSYILCIDTLFGMDAEEEVLRGHVLLLPDRASLQEILRALQLG